MMSNSQNVGVQNGSKHSNMETSRYEAHHGQWLPLGMRTVTQPPTSVITLRNSQDVPNTLNFVTATDQASMHTISASSDAMWAAQIPWADLAQVLQKLPPHLDHTGL